MAPIISLAETRLFFSRMKASAPDSKIERACSTPVLARSIVSRIKSTEERDNVTVSPELGPAVLEDRMVSEDSALPAVEYIVDNKRTWVELGLATSGGVEAVEGRLAADCVHDYLGSKGAEMGQVDARL